MGVTLSKPNGYRLAKQALSSGIINNTDNLVDKGFDLSCFLDDKNQIDSDVMFLFTNYLSNNLSVKQLIQGKQKSTDRLDIRIIRTWNDCLPQLK